MLARARRGATLGGRSQAAEMQILHADRRDVRGERGLREPWTARAGDGADVDEQLDLGFAERVEHRGNGRALLSNREHWSHVFLLRYPSRSAAGDRNLDATFPAWRTPFRRTSECRNMDRLN